MRCPHARLCYLRQGWRKRCRGSPHHIFFTFLAIKSFSSSRQEMRTLFFRASTNSALSANSQQQGSTLEGCTHALNSERRKILYVILNYKSQNKIKIYLMMNVNLTRMKCGSSYMLKKMIYQNASLVGRGRVWSVCSPHNFTGSWFSLE